MKNSFSKRALSALSSLNSMNSTKYSVKYRFWGGLFLAAISIMPAFAQKSAPKDMSSLQDHPTLSPQRDVVVTYRFQVGQRNIDLEPSHMKQVKVSFSAAGNHLRIDQIGGVGITILDRPAQKVTLINKEQKSYVQFFPQHGIHNPFMLDIAMIYKPSDMATIAGYPCRQWDIDTGRGKARACVTEDGIILSETGSDADGVYGKLEAIEVAYKDIPSSEFEPPADFYKIMPRLVPLSPNASQTGSASANTASEMLNHDNTEPHIANDSASDGTVQHADQPGSVTH